MSLILTALLAKSHALVSQEFLRDMMVARDRMLWELHVRSQHDGVWTGKDGRKWTIAGEQMQCDSGSTTRVQAMQCAHCLLVFSGLTHACGTFRLPWTTEMLRLCRLNAQTPSTQILRECCAKERQQLKSCGRMAMYGSANDWVPPLTGAYLP